MKKLLNTLYVTSPDSWLHCDGENVVVKIGGEERFRMPFHNLESIISFGRAGASPALMSACASKNIGLSFMSEGGAFMARVTGVANGNVVVRRRQYRLADSGEEALKIASSIIAAKISNSRKILERHIRDYGGRNDISSVKKVSNLLGYAKSDAAKARSAAELRGIEGNASKLYFSVFGEMILNGDGAFGFEGRNKRPPKDRTNALLSFAYTLLAHDVQGALESCGLDSYVGFFHTDRPGRAGLALDIMEELRAYIADRNVLSFINRRQVKASDFEDRGVNGVILKPDARREFIRHWQRRKQDEMEHPFLSEKIKCGLIPYAQALLLNKFLRGELDAYPVFLI